MEGLFTGRPTRIRVCKIIEKGVFASRGDSSKGLSEGEEVYPYLVRGGKMRESYAEL
jgi:hypothetical protein